MRRGSSRRGLPKCFESQLWHLERKNHENAEGQTNRYGAWHRIGLVWDGSNRILYADDIEVASDAQAGLTGTYKGLYLGAGSTLAPASFWSGLIDEVRIYNRAVKP